MLDLIAPPNMLIYAKRWEEATPSAFSPPKLAIGSVLSGPQVCAKAVRSLCLEGFQKSLDFLGLSVMRTHSRLTT